MRHLKKWENMNEAVAKARPRKASPTRDYLEEATEEMNEISERIDFVLDNLERLEKIKGINKYTKQIMKLKESFEKISSSFFEFTAELDESEKDD